MCPTCGAEPRFFWHFFGIFLYILITFSVLERLEEA